MSRKDLTLNVKLKKNQADSALRGLTSSLRRADTEMKKLEASIKRSSRALKGVKTEALNSSASIKEFGNISTEA
jgi:hypothetical protein